MRLSRIRKSFGATLAVDDVSLTIERGEILAVIGENGAGKTTLMRIAAGELAPDSGHVIPSEVEGPGWAGREEHALRSTRPGPSTTLGMTSSIGFVHQHFLLVPELTIAENLALIDRRFRFATRKTLDRDAVRMIESSGIELHEVSRRVAELSVGEKSKLELIKAIARKPSTLILDEPTSVLTPHESEELFRVMRALATNGTAIVFISHKLPEVLAVAERIVVMRAGKLVMETRSASPESLALAMTQSPLPGERATVNGLNLARETTPHPPSAPSPLTRGEGSRSALPLESLHLTREREEGSRSALPLESLLPATSGEKVPKADEGRRLPEVKSIGARLKGDLALSHGELELHHNEILAIVGVAGNGQSELANELRARFPHAGHIPEDRTRDGVIAQMTIAENLALRGVRNAEQMIELYSIRALGPRQLAGDLSGGNQQKVVLARELDRRPEIIVAAEPTRGLDLEATSFVHGRLRAAAAAGAAILLITSDLDEAFELADAMQVIYRGKLSARMTAEEASSRVANLMAGVV